MDGEVDESLHKLMDTRFLQGRYTEALTLPTYWHAFQKAACWDTASANTVVCSDFTVHCCSIRLVWFIGNHTNLSPIFGIIALSTRYRLCNYSASWLCNYSQIVLELVWLSILIIITCTWFILLLTFHILLGNFHCCHFYFFVMTMLLKPSW